MIKKTLYFSILFAFLLWRVIAQPFRVSGDCMQPAVQDGKLCFVNRLFPGIQQFKSGDIIVFKHEGIAWISRVVALEDDTIPRMIRESVNSEGIPIMGQYKGVL